MPETHGTPCPELKKLMEIVEKHEQRLGRGNIEFDENGAHWKKTQYRARLKISENGPISIEQESD